MIGRSLLAVGLVALLAACAGTGQQVSGWGEITVAAGDTGSCSSNPCRVYFQMPPGEGSYPVTIAHIAAGEYPAGSMADLGSFYESRAVRVMGVDVPPTYVYVPESSGSDPN
jgi:hypothetical protein